jgi:hypothetical protein
MKRVAEGVLVTLVVWALTNAGKARLLGSHAWLLASSYAANCATAAIWVAVAVSAVCVFLWAALRSRWVGAWEAWAVDLRLPAFGPALAATWAVLVSLAVGVALVGSGSAWGIVALGFCGYATPRYAATLRSTWCALVGP